MEGDSDDVIEQFLSERVEPENSGSFFRKKKKTVEKDWQTLNTERKVENDWAKAKLKEGELKYANKSTVIVCQPTTAISTPVVSVNELGEPSSKLSNFKTEFARTNNDYDEYLGGFSNLWVKRMKKDQN